MILGFGKIEFGIDRFGILKEETLYPTTATILLDDQNNIGTGRKFNPLLNDYEMNSNGSLMGSQTGSQKILLALKTTFNSSYVPNFGLELKNYDLIPGLQAKIKQDFERALKHITEIQIIKLDVIRDNSKIKFTLQYRDLNTNRTEVLEL